MIPTDEEQYVRKAWKAQGKKNRRDGAAFELRVRKHLESNGWIVDKWSNNVDIDNNTLIPAKHRYVGKNILAIGTGFPDFLVFKQFLGFPIRYIVTGVEVKSNGYLDKTEKAKCQWLLRNRIFKIILVASKGKEGEIVYKQVKGGNDDDN